MTPERWQRINDVLLSALEREVAERAAFIAETCGGDEELRHEVETLLASHEQASQFMEEPVAGAAARVFLKDHRRSVAGQQIGPYKVVELLGVGGMGEVYLAKDTRLGRQVALKLLPPHYTKEEDRLRRFRQEARAASSLNHPNILTVYEIGEADGSSFIATEFIDGETLRRRMKDTRMGVAEVIEIAVQVASALSAAHQGGIVHRDVKPENIMLRRDGYVKVLDFGLAKLTHNHIVSADDRTLVKTGFGVVTGTVTYMSPEQARAQEVDARTDIFSLGVVLYEMVTGRVPFEGATPGDMLASILTVEPPPLSKYLPDVPAELERIVRKALRKNPEERYQTVKDMALDLKNLRRELEISAEIERSAQSALSSGAVASSGGQMATTAKGRAARAVEGGEARPTSSAEYIVGEIKGHKLGTVLAVAALVITVAALTYPYIARDGKAINSLAVLPLINASGDPNNEYLSDGLTESLINSLSQLPDVKVIASGSVFRYKGRETDARAAGQELGVRGVLTGRIVSSGENLSISIELMDVSNNSRVWGERYQRRMSDLIALQQEVSLDVLEKLRLKLPGEEQKKVIKRYTVGAEAYQLYLKGRYHWNKRTPEGVKKSIEYFRQVIGLEPSYAPAYVGLADAYILLGGYNELPPREAYLKAEAAVTKALAIDDTLGEAHVTLATVKMNYDWDWSGAEREFKRAIELTPNYSTAHQWYARYLSAAGRHEEAITEIKRAQDLDPLSLIVSVSTGVRFYYARRYDQAIEEFRKAIELDPNFFRAHHTLGWAYEQKGMYGEAVAQFEKALALSERNPGVLASLARVHALSGERGEAQKVVNELRASPTRRHFDPVDIAAIYIALGDNDEAIRWLEKAYEERNEAVAFLQVEPRFDSIRSDPRFRDLLRRIGSLP